MILLIVGTCVSNLSPVSDADVPLFPDTSPYDVPATVIVAVPPALFTGGVYLAL